MLGRGVDLARRFARSLLGDYAAYYVYASPANSDARRTFGGQSGMQVQAIDQGVRFPTSETLVQDQAQYFGPGSYAYACLLDGRIAGVCIYWYGERYLKRNFWPLEAHEAKLVQIISSPEMRGRGVATALIAGSCADLLGKGFQRAYARVWHSNLPSRRAFERAGWTRKALVVEINPLRRQRPYRLRFDIAA